MRTTVTLLFGLCCFSSFSQGAERPASPVFIYQLAAGDVEQPVNLMGHVSALETTNITASVTELVSAIHFSDGQTVQAGDLLLEMTSAEEHAQLSQLRAQTLDAQQQYDRLRALKAAKLTSDASLDQQRASYESLQAQLKAVQARLADRLILAPFTGRLGLRRISVGSLIRPGDLIATLEDDSRVNLDIEVPEALRNLITERAPFEAQTLDGVVHIQGQLDHFDRRSNPTTHNLLARSTLPNAKGELLSGMSLKVQIRRHRHNQLMVPESALIQEGTRSYVFVLLPDAKVKRQSIQVDLRQNGWVTISSGLALGDKIVTQGAARLTPGASVKIMGEDHGQPLHDILQQAKP